MIQSVNTKPDSTLNLSWRDQRYHRFYEVVDYLVQELQEHVWIKTGKPKHIIAQTCCCDHGEHRPR